MTKDGSTALLKWAALALAVMGLVLGGVGGNYSMHSADRQATATLKETTNRTLDDHERRLVGLEQDRREIKDNQRAMVDLLHEIRHRQGD